MKNISLFILISILTFSCNENHSSKNCEKLETSIFIAGRITSVETSQTPFTIEAYYCNEDLIGKKFKLSFIDDEHIKISFDNSGKIEYSLSINTTLKTDLFSIKVELIENNQEVIETLLKTKYEFEFRCLES